MFMKTYSMNNTGYKFNVLFVYSNQTIFYEDIGDFSGNSEGDC